MGSLNDSGEHPNLSPDGFDVPGFDTPQSPESSYNNILPGNEDESKEPPVLPPHLQYGLLNYPVNMEPSGTLPNPHHVVLNHLYIESRESKNPVVGLGLTHRFHSKFVTVVLYKPLHR
eukprot:TRINITY_DN789_c1_g2_i1.p1 TRINITY_DN789_c1_g2~~TRINITY_DN789_c1_g2_i1.p1  ORF type:complete len:118 (+),score=24.44 TRINITY_DN789_c1_g2_i1:261-614(+)